MMDTKVCSLCETNKELGEFHRRHSGQYVDTYRAECKSCRSQQRKKNRSQDWASAIRRNYGWTVERYYETIAAQKGGCAVCGTRDPGVGKTYFAIDHNHATNATRGLLCFSCNVALGHAQDNVKRLLDLAAYLIDWE